MPRFSPLAKQSPLVPSPCYVTTPLSDVAADYLRFICRIAYGPLYFGPRHLAVLAYVDESYDNDIFTLAGALASEESWAALTRRWQARCSKDGISWFHATDCAGGRREFAGLTESTRIALNSD